MNLLHESNELNSLEKENILIDLLKARKVIDQLNEKIELKDGLKNLFNISDESIESIFKLALIKLDVQELEESLALFTLLVVLIPENADYCYRAGIIAQMCEHIDFALKMYSACLVDNPDIIEAKILSLDCCIKLGEKTKAFGLCNEINQYILNNVIDSDLVDMFTKLKNYLDK